MRQLLGILAAMAVVAAFVAYNPASAQPDKSTGKVGAVPIKPSGGPVKPADPKTIKSTEYTDEWNPKVKGSAPK